jgi:hypothetical protein
MIFDIGPQVTAIYKADDGYMQTMTPAGAFTDIRFLIGAVRFRSIGEETTIILARRLTDADLLDLAADDWKITSHGDSPWHALRRNGERINFYATDESDWIREHLFFQLGWWLDHVGTHYYLSPGVSTERAILAGADGKFKWIISDAWKPPGELRSITYKHKDYRPGVVVHRWDMRRAFLNALGAVELPLAQLRHTGADPSTLNCGYYRVRSTSLRTLWPSWFYPSFDRQGTCWVTQASLHHAFHFPEVEIVDSWTPGVSATSGHRRLFRSWAQDYGKIMDLAMSPSHGFGWDVWGPTSTRLKLGYAEMIGMWATPGGFVYRPDWRHMIIDEVRASILRRVINVYEATGHLWPVRINTDAVYYRLPKPEHAGPHTADQLGVLLGVGPNSGNMRYEGIDDAQA